MEDLFSFFEKPKYPLAFNAVRISLASPEKIRAWARETLPDQTTFVEYKQEVALAGGDANLEVELDAA
ncbi:MAG: hypothetical protein ABSB32_21505, partial [Thermodesulfobacteriota bacterium]